MRHLFGVTLELSSILELHPDPEIGRRIRSLIRDTDDLIQQLRTAALDRNGSRNADQELSMLSREAELVAALTQERELASQLQTALDSRVIIEQAKGMIAALRSVTIDEAFERLRTYSRNHGLKIHQVADAVVRRELLL